MMKILTEFRSGVSLPGPNRPELLRIMIMQIVLLTAVFMGFRAQAQDPPQYGTPFNNVPDPRDVNMYQAQLRIFSPGSNFASVTSRLDQIQALGINVLYLMPIFPHGTDAQSTPSPYCIKDFKAVASEYGNLNSLRQLVDGAHARGMAVILDIAINGTSWDHPWRTSHPEYFTGGQLGPFPDIAALNLNHSGTRAAIIDAMRYWIFAANIDGYRCDFANNPSLNFWSEVIGNLRGISSHDLLMFAEGDRLENFQAGFDLNFGDKWFYDALEDVSKLNASVSSRFNDVNNVEYTYANSVQQVVRYTGNHDSHTNGFNGVDGGARPFLMFNNHNGVVANFLVSAYMRGVPFLMSGQEVDYNMWTPWPWTGSNLDINWSQNPSASQDFADILNFRKNNTAVRRGALATYSSNDVCAFTKTSGSEKVVVIANMRNNSVNYTIPSALAGSYTNAYTGAGVTLNNGANQALAAYQYLVLTNSGGCSPIPIQPNIAVNGGSWQQTTSITVNEGDNVTLGPQPLDGTWSWSGPNGYSSTSRQQTFNNIQTSQAGTYTATYTNPCGAPSSLGFTITVNGSSTLPSPWNTSDIGAVGVGGSASHVSGTFTLNGSGADIWGAADEFRYAYQQVSGDVTVTARVASLNNTDGWAKAGVMIRNGLGAGAQHVLTAVTAANGLAFQRRTTNGGESTHTAGPSGSAPYWVRVVRSGNTFTSFTSTNGSSWTQTGSQSIAMSSSVYVGLAVTSHNDGVLTTATFTNVSVTTGSSSSLTLSTASQSFGNGSGSQSVNVTSNISWAVSDNQSWISASPASGSNSGSFSVSVTANTGAVRSGTVTVTGGGITRTIAVSQAAGSTGQGPYSGSPAAIPGTIELENFDTGGEGVAYHDTDAGNSGGQYRASDGVDLESCSEGGFNIGWTNTGEWVEYTVNVASSGNYTINARVAGGVGGNFRIEFDGVDETGVITVPNTGGWQSWQTATVNNVSLNAGQQVMRVYMNSGGFNLNNVSISSATGGGSVYRIQNRWNSSVLFDNGNQASYGSLSTSDPLSHWEQVSVDGHTAFRNVSTGHYLNMEGQQTYVECTSISTTFHSAQWVMESYDGHTRIRNRWQPTEYIHIENLQGYAQHGAIGAGAWSNQWTLVPVSGSRLGDESTESAMPMADARLYPNPFSSSVNIQVAEWQSNANCQVLIWDASGKEIYREQFKTDVNGDLSQEISAGDWKPGLYFVSLKANDNNQLLKVIKH